MNHLFRHWKQSPLGLVTIVLAVAALTGLFVATGVKSQEATSAGLALGVSENSQGGPAKAVLKSYPCAPGTVEVTASRLEQQYPPTLGVRIVADVRASQVLVIAPPEIQSQINERFMRQPASDSPADSLPQAEPASVASKPSTKPVVPYASARQVLQLWNISGRELEAALLRTLQERLSPVVASTSEPSVYQLTLPDGGQLTISIDRQKNQAILQGAGATVASATQLIHVLDHPPQVHQREIGFCLLNKARKSDVATVVAAFHTNQASPTTSGTDTAAAAPATPQPPNAAPQPQTSPAEPKHGEETTTVAPETPGHGQDPATTEIVPLPGAPENAPGAEPEGLVGPVQIQILDGLDVLVIRGHQRDVQRVMEIIKQIEQLSTETKPTIQILLLKHVDSAALAALLRQVYAEVFAARLGALSVTALGKPNSILLIGRAETVEMAADLTQRLDQPVPPNSQFQIFHLKSIPADAAQQNIEAFFAQQQAQAAGQQPRPQQQAPAETGSLAPRVQVVADFRSNSLIVRGSPRELAEVAALVQRMDGNVNAALNQVKVFRLKNSLAETLAPVLQDAITGQMYGQRNNRNQFAVQQAAGQQRQNFERKSARLQFVTVDSRGQQVLNSGILTDAQVTADARTNAVIVTASAESMPLIAALIQELDQPADVEAQVKVFTLANSDATSMNQMLEQIFGQADTTEGLSVRTGIAAEQSSLVGLKFAVDVRSNSVIVTGSSGALTVVEAILMRLDGSDVRNRRTSVYRLLNSPAADVATAVNEYLRSERQVQQLEPGLVSAFEQIEHEVVVVAEPVSNSLIISATPRFYDEIMKVIKDIDQRPPMVMIQVLIAQVNLDHTDEFGVELGLQDKVLFDRSTVIGSGDNATLVPGFQFNSQSMGNSGRSSSVATAQTVGGQSITNLGVGRTDSALGFGGLVLSASSESVSLLIRALQQQHRLQILSRPQVMTMDNQAAQILVGQKVPTITATQLASNGSTVNSVAYQEVGLIVTVTPRVSPDHLVVMEIQAEKSKLEPISQGIPISISPTGEPIRSPIIDTTSTRTVVSALDGQTVVLGGMIETSTDNLQNKVPYLAEIPVLGHLFQYKAIVETRTELLIIMTPRIVTTAQDAETIKRVEAARMHWCLCDVMALHDGDGLGKNGPAWYDGDAAVVYPDLDPTLKTMQQLVPPGEGTAPLVAPEMINTPRPNPSATREAVPGQSSLPPGFAVPEAVPRSSANSGAPSGSPSPGVLPNGAMAVPPGSPAATAMRPSPYQTTQVRILSPPKIPTPSSDALVLQETWGQVQTPSASAGPNSAAGLTTTVVYATPAQETQTPANPEQPASVRYSNTQYPTSAYPTANR